ncbi:hypothetical protein HY628_02140 [Candidatus Uhrbacteria bacterium]|nr:hypothetical protein [Candidatus Uhrbacteria bacterium]
MNPERETPRESKKESTPLPTPERLARKEFALENDPVVYLTSESARLGKAAEEQAETVERIKQFVLPPEKSQEQAIAEQEEKIRAAEERHRLLLTEQARLQELAKAVSRGERLEEATEFFLQQERNKEDEIKNAQENFAQLEGEPAQEFEQLKRAEEELRTVLEGMKKRGQPTVALHGVINRLREARAGTYYGQAEQKLRRAEEEFKSLGVRLVNLADYRKE